MKSIKSKRILRIILISVSILLTLAVLAYLIDDTFFQLGITAHIMCPPENRQRPDFSGEITDVRVTTVERDFSYSLFFKWRIESSYPDASPAFRQIYYGYCMDGKWYDFPCENYELRELLFNESNCEAAHLNHCVQIGPYVLISISISPFYNELDCLAVIEDTLNSSVTAMTQYASSDPRHGNVKGSNSVYVHEHMFHKYELWRSDGFDKYYYVILKTDEIPDDYTISYNVYVEYSPEYEYNFDDSDTNIYTFEGDDGKKREYRKVKVYNNVYTYDDIMEALNRE